MTVRDIISRSLRLLGVLASGETAEASQTQDALTTMNAMVSAWKNDGLLIYKNQIQTVSLIASQQSYTIGTLGDFAIDRPDYIVEAKYSLNNIEYPIEILNLKQWADIPNKLVSGSIPTKLYYNPEYPLGVLYFWPLPNGASSVVLYYGNSIDSFTSINTTVSLPPGYEDLLVYGTAERIAPEYGKDLSASSYKILKETISGIKRRNTKPHYAIPDQTGAGRMGTFDFDTGGYR